MFKIGEFSRLTMVSVRMLRYYDENNLLKPAVVDPYTGYRFYSSDQIKDLNKIIFLRDTGFTIAEIKDALENWHNDYLHTKLTEKRNISQERIAEEKQRIINIEKALSDINANKIETNYNIMIKSEPSFPVISLRRIIPSYFDEGYLWKELFDFIEKNNIVVKNSANIAIYHDLEYKTEDVDVEVTSILDAEYCISKGPILTRYTNAVDKMAYTMVYGSFENINNAYFSFAAWIESSPYRMSGKSRQIVHKGPWNETNSENYLTEMQIELE